VSSDLQRRSPEAISGLLSSDDSLHDLKAELELTATGSSAAGSAAPSALHSALRSWQSQFDQIRFEVQGLAQRWCEASAAREKHTQMVGGLLAAAAPTASCGIGITDALVKAVREAMDSLSAALQRHQPTLERLLSAAEQKLQSERTADTEWRQTSSTPLLKLSSDFEPVINQCRALSRSLGSLRERWAQYDQLITAFCAQPPKGNAKKLALLKVDLEHAESDEERACYAAKIRDLETEPREYRLRWRAARDALIECLNSDYFAELEKNECLKYLLLPER
jgi:hypothetical protein